MFSITPKMRRNGVLLTLGLTTIFSQSSAQDHIPLVPAQPADPIEVVMNDFERDERLSLFDAAIKIVRAQHFSQDRVRLMDGRITMARMNVRAGSKTPFDAVNDVLNSLDPHSAITQIDPAEPRGEAEGFAALGLFPARTDAGLRVERIYHNGSAMRAGLRVGDLITTINGRSVTGQDMKTIEDLVCDTVSERLRIGIRRETASAVTEQDIQCDYDHRRAVSTRVVDGRIGYIRLNEFSRGSADDVRDAVRSLAGRAGGVDAYILDLRDNPGGFVDEAHAIIDAFVDSRQTLFQETGRAGLRSRFAATPGDVARGRPLMVLVNHNSWSAAELTAMSLQYQSRAVIIGGITAGKGSVQNLNIVASATSGPMRRGLVGEMRLTVALYSMPNGQSPQQRGVVPDLRVAQEEPVDTARRESQYLTVINNPNGNALTPADTSRAQSCVLPVSASFAPDIQRDPALACGVQVFRSWKYPVRARQARVAAFTPR